MSQKTIDTLIPDILSVVRGQGGWNKCFSKALGKDIKDLSRERFCQSEKVRKYLSMSSIGAPCKRKVWLRVNDAEGSIPPKGSELLKFFFGDFVEALLLNLAESAGHTVLGKQDTLAINGVQGHRDAVIDGMTVDVKSASPVSYRKFKMNELRDSDPFGYISQLSSYVYAAKDDPLVTDKTRGAFLVINKVTGELHLDIHDFSTDLIGKESEIEAVKSMVKSSDPPPRLEPVPQYKDSSNLKLCSNCHYCEFKRKCWPNLRTFLYAKGVEHLVHVEQEPRARELPYYSDV